MLNLAASLALLQRLPIQSNIEGQEGVLVPFRLKYNQLLVVKKIQDRIDAGHPFPFWMIFCKARRVGVSSLVEGLLTCKGGSAPNSQSLIVAHLTGTSEALFRVPTNLVKAWPFTLPPPLKTKITFPHPAGDSIITIATADTVVGGRGGTLTDLHLSEAAYFPVGGGSFTSLMPSVIRNRSSICVVESTANGKQGQGQAFYELWMDSVEGRTEFMPIFLSWLDDVGCRRPASEVRDGVAGLQDDDERDILSKLGCPDKCGRCANCDLALQCIAWRRWAIPNLCQGYVEVFHQEFPTTADESFISTGNPAFTREELRNGRERLCDPVSIGRLDQVGGAKPIRINFTPSDSSPLLIWRHPEYGRHYYIGADAARGAKRGDYAAAVGICGETGEQVFRYMARIDPIQLATTLHLLGNYYNRALVAIELTGNLGLWAQKNLRDHYNYPHLYRWKGRDDRSPLNGPTIGSSIGWETNIRTRKLLLIAMRAALTHKTITLHDEILLTQMEAAELDNDRWVVDNRTHDDVLIATMIAWIAKEQWHTDMAAQTAKQLPTEGGKPTHESDLAEVRGSQPTVALMAYSHWKRIQDYNRLGHFPITPQDRLKDV